MSTKNLTIKISIEDCFDKVTIDELNKDFGITWQEDFLFEYLDQAAKQYVIEKKKKMLFKNAEELIIL